PTHQYNTAGTFTVILTITDADGDSNKVTQSNYITVIVDLNPSATFTGTPTAIIPGQTVSFTHTGSNGNAPATYQWNFGDLTANGTTENPTHQYVSVGTYTVILTVTDNDGDRNTFTRTSYILVATNLIPSASFTGTPTSIIAGQSVSFTHTGNNGNTPATYQWSYGDGTANGTTENPTHQYNTAGTFTVILTIVDADGDNNTFAQSNYITVATDLAPSATFTGTPTSIIAGQSVTFTHTGSNGNSPATYQWSFGDATANGTTENPTHQYATAGTYTVVLMITDADGDSNKVTRTSYITVAADLAPSATFTGTPTSIIAGQSVTFTHTGSNGNSPATYQWSFGDGTANGTTENPAHFYLTAGTYTVAMTVVDLDGDGNTYARVSYIQVAADLIPAADFNANATVILTGAYVAFSYTGTTGNGIISYQWNFGDGSGNSTVASPSHRYTSAGVYTVRLNVVDTDGDSDFERKVGYITVGADLVPIADFTANATSIVAGQYVRFTFAGTPGNGIVSYQWNVSGPVNYTVASPVHRYTTDGTYTVTLTIVDTDGDASTARKTSFIAVAVDVFPMADFTANTTSIYMGLSIQFTFNGSVGNNPASYRWNFTDGTANATSQNPVHRFMNNGTYTIILTIVDADGELSTTSKVNFITVTPDMTAPVLENITIDAVKVYNVLVNTACDVLETQSGIELVQVMYAVNQNVTFSSIVLNHGSGNHYTGQIPTQNFGAIVYYYYRAIDRAGNSMIVNNSGAYYNYTLDYLPAGTFTLTFTDPVTLTVVITVTTAGYMALDTYDSTGLQAALNMTSLLVAFDLSFTGGFSALTIMYQYTGTVSSNLVRVFHLHGGDWTVITPNVNADAKIITFQLTSLSPIAIGTIVASGFDIVKFIVDNWLMLSIVGIGMIVVIGAVAASRRKKKIAKAGAKGKEKGTARYTDGSETPAGAAQPATDMLGISTKVLPTELVAKKKQAAKSAAEETAVQSTPEEMAQMETEMKVDANVDRCIVCKKELAGDVFICPSCKNAKYHYQCVEHLIANNEPCWYCKKTLSEESRKETEALRLKLQYIQKNMQDISDKFKKNQMSEDSFFQAYNQFKKDKAEIEKQLRQADSQKAATTAVSEEQPFNLYCPLCEQWTQKPGSYIVTGNEICKKCSQPLYFVPKCDKCGHGAIKPVKEFSAFKNSPMACERCGSKLRIQ
nr:PKD domain-containing protein [Candidatus Sigynarchaeota archaeon]